MRFIRIAVILSVLSSAAAFPAHALSVEKPALPLSGINQQPGYYQKLAVERFSRRGMTGVDSLRVLVIRVSFSDRDFLDEYQVYPPHDSVYFENELRHLREYYNAASLGRFSLASEMYEKVVEVSRSEGYYGGREKDYNLLMSELMIEVADSVDSLIDFSRYGSIALIHAGAGRETDIYGDSPNQIWSGFIDPDEVKEAVEDSLGVPGIPTDDFSGGSTFYIDNFLILPETSSQDGMTFGSLGIYAFQLGKRLGMLPMYDSTPSGFSDSQGIGNFGLMSYGLYNALGIVPAFPSAFNRYIMGWVEPEVIDFEGRIELTGINQPGSSGVRMARVDIGASEYFLLVNRDHDSDFDGLFDFGDINGDGIPQNGDTLAGAEFDFFITQETNSYTEGDDGKRRYNTGSGLMIWHIDERVIAEAVRKGDFPNDDRVLSGVDLEEADGVQDMDRPGGTYSFGSNYDSFREGNRDRFSGNTMPSSRGNSGIRTGIEISGISQAGPVMSFDISREIAFPSGTVSISGSTGRLNPIALPGDAGTSVALLADSGLVYLIEDAGGGNWRDRVSIIGDFGGVSWKGGAVAGRIDNQAPVIFSTCYPCGICAVRSSGEVYDIDDDLSPGTLEFPDSSASLPVMIDIDDDNWQEVLVLSSSADSVYFNLIGADIFGTGTETGSGVFRAGVDAGGTLFSEPSAGMILVDGAEFNGLFLIVRNPGYDIIAQFWAISAEGPSMLKEVEISRSYTKGPGLLIPSAGDLDGDGSDEMVIPLSGRGVLFWNPARNIVNSYERLERFSPASLSDINGDGIPEVAVRTPEKLYLFTGEGVLMEDFPIKVIDPGQSPGESSLSQPLLADIDSDGKNEIVAGFYGGLFAFGIEADGVEGFPLPDGGTGTPVIFEGGDDSLCLAAAGTVLPYSGGGASSRILRYTFEGPIPDNGWFMFRNDPFGTSRADKGALQNPDQSDTGKGTFYCYPNPVEQERLYLRGRIDGPADLRIRILNIEGETVMELTGNHYYARGSSVPFEKSIDVGSLAGGVYIFFIEVDSEAGNWTDTAKFAITR